MKKKAFDGYGILFAALLAVGLQISCTEKIDVKTRGSYEDYLCVEATLTDRPDRPQTITLKQSISFFHGEDQPPVTGARIKVDDGLETVYFTEGEPGKYTAPEGYHAEEGRTYHLQIELADGTTHEASASMPEKGFQLDAVDYMWAGDKQAGLDSLWTVAVWGRDLEITSFYYITGSINGVYFPFMFSNILDDQYFNGRPVFGFPVTTLIQTHDLRELYGDCFKYLETGDVISIEAWSLTKDYYEFLFSVYVNSNIGSIPLFSPQPANAPTNISGEKVMGYFAVCPVSEASIVVDDPLRAVYKMGFPTTKGSEGTTGNESPSCND